MTARTIVNKIIIISSIIYEAFKADNEIHKARAAAGVDLANTVTTPMGDDFLEQYKG